MVVREDILEDPAEDKTIVVERDISDILTYFRRQYKEELRSDFLPPGERLRRPIAEKDLDEALDLIRQVIDDEQNAANIPVENRVIITEEFPQSNIETEVITYSLVRRAPASISAGPIFNQKVQEWKPHIRSIEPDPNYAGKVIFTLGQAMENEIKLTCWAKTNKQANRRARWLENVLQRYTWWIKYNGIVEFFFTGQASDQYYYEKDAQNMITGRPLHYYLRTEKLTNVSEETIRKLIIRTSTSSA